MINIHLGGQHLPGRTADTKQVAEAGIEFRREALVESKMKHIDNLTYKTFVNKFNDTYAESLRQEQRDLLTNFIISFSVFMRAYSYRNASAGWVRLARQAGNKVEIKLKKNAKPVISITSLQCNSDGKSLM